MNMVADEHDLLQSVMSEEASIRRDMAFDLGHRCYMAGLKDRDACAVTAFEDPVWRRDFCDGWNTAELEDKIHEDRT